MRNLKTKLVFAYMLPFAEECNVGKLFDTFYPEEMHVRPIEGYILFKPLKVKQTVKSDLILPKNEKKSLTEAQYKERYFTCPTFAVVMANGKRFKDEPIPVRPYSLVYMNDSDPYDLHLVNVNGKKDLLNISSARRIVSVHEVSWRKLLTPSVIKRYFNFFIIKKR